MVFVVHGEDTVCDDFTTCLNEEYQIPAFAPFSGALFDLATGVWIKEGLKIPVSAEKPAAKRKSDMYTRLIEAGKRLMQVIYHTKAEPTRISPNLSVRSIPSATNGIVKRRERRRHIRPLLSLLYRNLVHKL